MVFTSELSLGAPRWFELGTTDQAAAKQSYSRLFGRSANDNSTASGQFYTVLLS